MKFKLDLLKSIIRTFLALKLTNYERRKNFTLNVLIRRQNIS